MDTSDHNQPQHYSLELKLSKKFLMTIHSHALVKPFKGSGGDELYTQSWKNAPDFISRKFGGISGKQFSSIDQVVSFTKAFDNIMTDFKIPYKFKHELLYLITFYQSFAEKQDARAYFNNSLLESARFLAELITDSYNYRNKLIRDDSYERLADDWQTVFVKKEFLEDGLLLDGAHQHSMKPPNIIVFKRTFIYDTTVDLFLHSQPTISFPKNCPQKSYGGKLNLDIQVPASIRMEVTPFIIGTILDAHKMNNTKFYNLIKEKDFDLRKLSDLSDQYITRNLSPREVLIRISILIKNYLTDNTAIKSDLAISKFLHKYYSLFGVLQNKDAKTLPIDYTKFSKSDEKKGPTEESIRQLLKEGNKLIGGI